MIIDSSDLIGQSLGTCTLQRLIGRGGMGAVYLAQQTRPRRTVAVKVLMPGIVLEPKTNRAFLARFRREADAVAALDHVNILQIYEYGEQGDTAYLVIPYVTGGTLRERLERRKALPLQEIVPILEQAAAALDCAHAQGIVHRDLKPGNILFHADGRVLLADFGLAKVLKDATEEGQNSPSGGALTSAGTIIGTPEYLSPEQGTGNPLDYHTDIYSLGVMLFQMIVGKVPFSGGSPVATAIKHAMEEPPSITALNPSIPHSVEAVVKKAMAKKPEERFSSAGEMAQAFKDAVQGIETQPLAHLMYTHPSNEVSTEDRESNDTQPEALIVAAHEAPTEEAPRLPADVNNQVEKDVQAVIETTLDLDQQPEIVSSQLEEQREQKQSLIIDIPKKQTRNNRKVQLLLAGCIVALFAIISSFLLYTHTPPANARRLPDDTTTNLSPVASQTQVPTTVFVPFAYALSPSTQPAGQMLYATNIPASCDTRGGAWESQGSITTSCSTNGATLKNTGATQFAGAFLSSLPNKQVLPDNYILQVTVLVQPDSHGEFGVFFRNQAKKQSAFSFMLQAPQSWTVYGYTAADTPSPITNPVRIHVPFGSTLTLDLVVKDGSFVFYLNGQNIGQAESSFYTSGTLGLAVAPNTHITYKNVAIYAVA